MRPENAYSLALLRETTEPAVNSRYGSLRNQQPIVPCGRTLSQTVLGCHWRGSQRLSGLASRHQRRLSHALSDRIEHCQRIEHCHVRNQKNEHSFGEPSFGENYTWPFILADVKTPLLVVDFLQANGQLVDLQSKRLVNATSFASSTLRQSNQTSLGLHHVTSDDPYSRLLEQFPTITRRDFSSKSVRHGVEHFIQTEGPPEHARARRLPPDKLVIAKEEFRKMEDMGIIRRPDSPWSSPLHMMPKNSGGWRPCGDFRCLNDVTTADRSPVPHIQDFA